MKELIDKSKQLTSFLEEAKKVIEAEKHKYIVKFEYKMGDENVYSLFNNEENRLIKLDKMDRIKSYFNLRNVAKSDIYYHNL